MVRSCPHGTRSGDFVTTEIARIASALHAHGDLAQPQIDAALAVLDGARPRDEVEAMLLSEMAVTHGFAMDLLGRAKRAKMTEQMEAAGNLAVRLLRAFTCQFEVLATQQRGGKQVVEVHHVHRMRGRGRKGMDTKPMHSPPRRGARTRSTGALSAPRN